MAAVAEELGYTAGAVSQQLARLEAAVGQPLLSKVGRGVRLTDAGRVLADHAIEVLRAEEAAAWLPRAPWAPMSSAASSSGSSAAPPARCWHRWW